MTIKQVPLSALARNKLASMAYEQWSVSYESLKAVKALTWESAGKFCPKAEWPQYHTSMVINAEKELAEAAAVKDEICKWSPIVMGE